MPCSPKPTRLTTRSNGPTTTPGGAPGDAGQARRVRLSPRVPRGVPRVGASVHGAVSVAGLPDPGRGRRTARRTDGGGPVTPRMFTTHLMIATDDVIAHFTVAVHADGTATVEAAKL